MHDPVKVVQLNALRAKVALGERELREHNRTLRAIAATQDTLAQQLSQLDDELLALLPKVPQ